MRTENPLDTDKVGGLVLRLAVPSMLAQFVSVLYSIIDRMYIGNIKGSGELALAGVGVCGPIVTMISAFAFLIGIGGAPLMSISLGRKDEKEAERILANCFLMLSIISVVVTIASLFAKNKLLMEFGASEVTFPYANDYMTIYLMGTIFALLSVGMNQFIICQGFAKTGMLSVLLGAALNIILDPVFIFGFQMGVKGAALATVFSQLASCACVLIFLFSRCSPISITFGNYSLKIMGRVLMVGFTPFLIIAADNVLIIALNTVIQNYGGRDGDMLLTCTTIVQSFMLMITMPLGGITGGTQTILGFNYGAQRPERIMKAVKYIMSLCLAFNAIMFLAAQTVPELFVRIFTQNSRYIELTVRIIRRYTIGVIPLAVQYTLVDGLTGMGLTRYSISYSVFRKAVFLTAVFVLARFWDIQMVFFAEPVSDILGTLVTVAGFLLTYKKIIYHSLSTAE